MGQMADQFGQEYWDQKEEEEKEIFITNIKTNEI